LLIMEKQLVVDEEVIRRVAPSLSLTRVYYLLIQFVPDELGPGQIPDTIPSLYKKQKKIDADIFLQFSLDDYVNIELSSISNDLA